jgi:prolyl oligopeptidase PreP (S9A serine peptidase family)
MVVDVIHGAEVPDPYRGLEDAADPATVAWSAEQDRRFEAARATWPQRDAFAARLDGLFRTGAVGPPVWRGDRAFALRRDPDQEHAVLVVTEPSGAERVLIDPAAIDPSGDTTLDTWAPSKEGDLVAYATSVGGAEWATVRVLDVAGGAVVDGPITRTRHPSIAWLPGGRAFYYPRYLSTDDTGEDRLLQRLYRHELGTDPDGDELVFGAGRPRATWLGASSSDDGKWLAVTASRGTDDFAAAADWLTGQGVTTPDRLGIYGRSNGGLLVGAALTRHPDKYAAVVCAAPLLDMLRYERFGLGEMWNGEYGTVADPVEFGWLRAYSPYHHVRPGTDYPATLFVVFDGDTRVDPLHARKMCALLQEATAGDRPILLRRETGVGHSSRAISRDVDLAADELAFLAAQISASASALA